MRYTSGMSADSIWISPDTIVDFFSWVFRSIGNVFGFVFGVGEPFFTIAGVGIYPLDIILALLLAGIGMFYTTFKEKYDAINKQRDAQIAAMYLRTDPVVIQNKRWENISYLVRTPNPADWKIAIIDCDNMLDDLFMRLGYPGATLGERMKSANKANFPMLDEAWEAHKIRNQIAHQSGFSLDAREALRVYYLYERVFRDARYI